MSASDVEKGSLQNELHGDVEKLVQIVNAEQVNVYAAVSQRDNAEASDQFSDGIRNHVSSVEHVVKKLTQEQYRIIDRLRGVRQARIRGCPGSGKTLVAAEKAVRLSNAGITTLFLCHNPFLSEYVRRMTEEQGVHVLSFIMTPVIRTVV